MPVVLYKDKNFNGPNLRLQPGFYSGRRDLEGTTRGSSSGEDLNNQISSIRVDNGYIAVIYSGMSPTPGGLAGGARALIGPAEIPDLGAVGMDDKTSSIRVLMFEPFRSATPRDFGVTLYHHAHPRPGGGGIHIGQGNFDKNRLQSDEVKVNSGGVRAMCVGPSTIAVLYEGSNFETTLNSTVVLPGECIADISDLKLSSTGDDSGINSIRVLYAAESGNSVAIGETPFQRAVSTLGTAYGAPRPLRIPLVPARAPAPPAAANAPRREIIIVQQRPPHALVLLLVVVVALLVALIRRRPKTGGAPATRAPPTGTPSRRPAATV